MANPDHLHTLPQGAAAWNAWRKQHPVEPDLRGADLREADFRGASLIGADLRGADLRKANLSVAHLYRSDLTGADLREAHFFRTDLSRANLHKAHLNGAHLREVHLNGADLREAHLNRAAWGHLDQYGYYECRPHRLPCLRRIGMEFEAQRRHQTARFGQYRRERTGHHGRRYRDRTGRFTEGRIAVLERLRAELRQRRYVPIVFNFDKPETKDFTETVRLLAGLSRFVIADVSNPKSAPLELQAKVPEIMIPFLPIIEEGEKPFTMLEDLWIKHREWVFQPLHYSSPDALIGALDKEIIGPAEARFDELVVRKAEKMKGKHV